MCTVSQLDTQPLWLLFIVPCVDCNHVLSNVLSISQLLLRENSSGSTNGWVLVEVVVIVATCACTSPSPHCTSVQDGRFCHSLLAYLSTDQDSCQVCPCPEMHSFTQWQLSLLYIDKASDLSMNCLNHPLDVFFFLRKPFSLVTASATFLICHSVF